MTKWSLIDKDIDPTNNSVIGGTFTMKVPGGMLVRTIMISGSQTMVFIPMNEVMIGGELSSIDEWINKNRIT